MREISVEIDSKIKSLMQASIMLCAIAPSLALAQATISQQVDVAPIEPPTTWISKNDIAKVSRSSVTSHFAEYSFNVLRSGSVKNCNTMTSSGNADLDKIICLSIESKGKYKTSFFPQGDEYLYSQRIIFYIGKFGKPITIFEIQVRKNLDEIMGADPNRIIALPSNDPAKWVSSTDYPNDIDRTSVIGPVRFIVKVSHEGLPISCVVGKSSGNELLDSAACTLVMRRAKFHPPKDREGRSSDGYFASGVSWGL